MSFHKMILVSMLAIVGLSLIQAKPLDPSAESLPVGGGLNREAATDATTEKDKSIDVDQQDPAVNNAMSQNNAKGYDSAPVQKSSDENGPDGKPIAESKPIDDERTPVNGIADKPTIGENDPGNSNIEEAELKAPIPDDGKIPDIQLGRQPDGSESNLPGLPSQRSAEDSNKPSLGPIPQPGNELGAPPGGPQGFQNLPTEQPATSSWLGNGWINSNTWNDGSNGGGQFGTNWNARQLPPQIALPPNYGTRLFNGFGPKSMHPGFTQVKLPAYGPFYWYPIVNEGNVVRWILAPASYAALLGRLPYERAMSPLEATSNSDGSAFAISGIASGFQPWYR